MERVAAIETAETNSANLDPVCSAKTRYSVQMTGFAVIHLKDLSARFGMSLAYWTSARKELVRAGIFVSIGSRVYGCIDDVEWVLRCRQPGESWFDAARQYRERMGRNSQVAADMLTSAMRAADRALEHGDAAAARIHINRALRDLDNVDRDTPIEEKPIA